VNCLDCVTNITLPNRGDLLCDAYCASDILASTPSLYTGADVNTWLNGEPSTFNYRMNAYYGVLGNYGNVPTYGADGALAVDGEMVGLALALGQAALQPSSSAGVTAAEVAEAHDLMQLLAVIQERIDQNNWSGNLTSVSNDGAVPDFSGSFDGATVAKTVSCVTSDHADMLEGTGGNCTDQTTGLTATLYEVLDADLESLVSFSNPLPTATLLSPSSATAGGAGFTLTVSGTNFVLGGTVQWNGTGLTTTYVSGKQLTASVSAGDITAAGTVPVTVLNPSPGGGTSNALTFTVNKPGPTLTLSPPSVNFGIQLLSTPSAARTVTLSNNGTASLTLTSIGIAGANRSDFDQNNNCPISPNTFAPSASCQVNATFSPTVSGPRKSGINVQDSSGDSLSIPLTGVGTAVSLSPASLSFPSQSVGTGGTPQTVTLSNSGSSPVNMWQMALRGANAADFSKSSTCGHTLAAGSNCGITVTFTPSAAGTRSASLLISDDGGGSPQSVSLSGIGSGDPNAALVGGRSNAIAVDAAGNAYAAGQTSPPDFPVTPGPALPQLLRPPQRQVLGLDGGRCTMDNSRRNHAGPFQLGHHVHRTLCHLDTPVKLMLTTGNFFSMAVRDRRSACASRKDACRDDSPLGA
jgi:hypothetical protein